MIQLLHPWALILLPLPLILRKVLPARSEARQAVRVPWFHRIATLLSIEPAPGAVIPRESVAHRTCWLLAWGMVVLALARPVYLEPPVERVVPSRDLLLLVDLSGSMEARDFTNSAGETVDRLTAVKEVLDEFLTRREGDRVGLIVFGNAAFVQVPFTTDLEVCRILLDELEVRMAGPRTALGDAIGLGITLFQRSDFDQRVMIALTDGNDTGSRIPLPEAAGIARDNDITVHMVGVGDPTTTGEDALDEEALLDVASTTGGQYFHAGNREELVGIYTELDRLSTREVQVDRYYPRRQLFAWPLGGFLCLTWIYHGAGWAVRPGRRRSDEERG